MIRMLGAGMIVTGCTAFGFLMAAAHRREERHLVALSGAMEYMHCELRYRQSNVLDLCRGAAKGREAAIASFFLDLAQGLEEQTCPDLPACLERVLDRPDLSDSVRRVLEKFGETLGRFDLPGQMRGIEAAARMAETELARVREGAAQRRRSYQTLGLCAGAALAILFL